ncbi:MAG TPA: peptide deformylase [Pyrinomonadaceae bacterium]|nr:peptide deformylase [Pyrinomonadaceae bacterium]
MSVLKITEYPERVLLEPSVSVENFDGELEKLVEDMFDTMYKAEGVGLAAPQVGLGLRLFVMDCEGIKLVAANPEIIDEEGEQTSDEGCLSIGKIYAPVTRAARVTLRAQDIRGHWFEREATALAARCFLHETDHLNGTLFIEHLTPLKRDMVKKRFAKIKKLR